MKRVDSCVGCYGVLVCNSKKCESRTSKVRIYILGFMVHGVGEWICSLLDLAKFEHTRCKLVMGASWLSPFYFKSSTKISD